MCEITRNGTGLQVTVCTKGSGGGWAKREERRCTLREEKWTAEEKCVELVTFVPAT